ncbi:MAG TPA: hypothetical protein PKA64_07320 [Myxococcota bacterium]|nr:hypothetical protein [Myxococcota bacterium]
MSAGQVQISAYVSEETRTLLEQATEARGLKKGFVIEEALLLYLHALRELPSDIIVPSRLVLGEASAQRVHEALASGREPTSAMRALMAGEAGDDVPA